MKKASFVSRVLGHERLMGFSDLLDVGSEGNLPNLYSSAAAMLLFVTAGSHWEKQQRKCESWPGFSFTFRWTKMPNSRRLRIFHLVDGLLFMSWVIIGIPIVAIRLAIYFFPFVMSLPVLESGSGTVLFWGHLRDPDRSWKCLEGKYFAAHGDSGGLSIMQLSTEEAWVSEWPQFCCHSPPPAGAPGKTPVAGRSAIV